VAEAGRAGDAAAGQAAKAFKEAVTKEQWTQALAGCALLSAGRLRKVASRQYTERLPGASGQVRRHQYDTVFESKQSAVETITPMLDPDGAWRVSG
jgi:hypothetical protein